MGDESAKCESHLGRLKYRAKKRLALAFVRALHRLGLLRHGGSR